MAEQKTAWQRVLDWVLHEYGGSLAADATNNLITRVLGRGGKDGKEYIQQAADLFKQGKVEEAKKMIESKPGGWGMADEQILLNDLLALHRGRLISSNETENAQKATAMASFLCGLQWDERRQIRHAHVKETNANIRRANLVVVANLPDDAARRLHYESAGVLDPTFTNAVARLDRTMGAVNRRREGRIRRHEQRITAVRNKPRGWFSRESWGHWFRAMGDFRPF